MHVTTMKEAEDRRALEEQQERYQLIRLAILAVTLRADHLPVRVKRTLELRYKINGIFDAEIETEVDLMLTETRRALDRKVAARKAKCEL